jgi:broad specificity phosphatase PhoE
LRLIVIRHAQTVWNATGRIQGQADPELSEVGREQCELVAQRLAAVDLDALYTSDLSRASETAEAIARLHPGLAAQLDSDLREVDLGEWEGADRDSLQRGWPDLFAQWLKSPSWDMVPGGEGSAAFEDRVVRCFGRIAADAGDQATVAVVTHIGVLRCLLSKIVGISAGSLRFPWAVDNTALTVLRGPVDRARWLTPEMEIVAINDNLHLRSAERVA